jgi:hypothetical protein
MTSGTFLAAAFDACDQAVQCRLVLRRGPFRQMETDLRQLIEYGSQGTRRPARVP